MNRKPTEAPLKTWQFFSACLYHMGMEFLTTLYKKSERQIHRWSSDPDTTESHQRNPIDRYEALLGALMERGKVDIARGCVRRQASVVGCFLTTEDIPHSDKDTMAEECLDDLPALADFHLVLQDPAASPEMVREAMAGVESEIRQNYDRWCQERGLLA